MITLANDEIHLWFTFPSEITDNTLLNNYQQLLTEEEHQRWQRFHFKKHQHQYLMTRALVRTSLSHYINITPKDWQFSKNEFGKPAISPHKNLFFNLSNTETLIVCAISRQSDIGIDVETWQHKSNILEIAQRFFSDQEVRELLSCPQSQQRQRFFQYWTLKESYIKACGMGLSQPLEQFSFSINQLQKKLTLSFHQPLKGNPNHWQCWLLQVTTEHYAAVSIFNPQAINYKLQVRQVIPLKKEVKFDYNLLATS